VPGTHKNIKPRGPIITIDGPAGSGKSTTARILAARLGFAYLDTGAMYRAAALLADRLGTRLDDEGEVQAMLASFDLAFMPALPSDDRPRVILAGEDVTEAIRTPHIDKLVSPIAAHATIRRHMAGLQKKFAQTGNVVLDGRDTGTVVCPDADVKIYLDASLTERAKRRLNQRADDLSPGTMQKEQSELDRRDRADRKRHVGPLRVADDAIVVDTSKLSIEQQIDKVYQICSARLKLQ
jgi:cytidylate kinase